MDPATGSQVFGATLKPDARAHNLLVGSGVEIHPSAAIGANVVIHDDVTIGPEVVIKHGAVIGQEPSLAETSRAVPQALTTTVLSAGVTVCNQAIVMRGAQVGANTIVGDFAYLREGASLGEDCVIGRGVGVGPGADVRDRVVAQSYAGITPLALVEDDVFIGGYAYAVTDNSVARDPGEANNTVILRRACRIGAGVVMLAGIEIGEEAMIGAGSVVRESVPARAKVAGVPARLIGRVADDEILGA